MKKASLILVISLAITIVLIGCGSKSTIQKTTAKAANNGSSITIQNTEGNNSSSNKTNHTSTGSSNAVGGNQLAMEAYKAVLQNKSKLYDTDGKKNVYLNNFLTNNGSFDDCVFKAMHFAVLDMNGDKIPEVVIELAIGNNQFPDFYEVLHYTNNEVQGYLFGIRSLEGLKADGSFGFSSGAADDGIGKLRFQNKTYKMDIIACRQSSENQDPVLEKYFINNKSVTSDAWESFMKKEDTKEDAVWYEFSSKNIEMELSVH